ncbi:ROK family transcriptional regulator [Actinomadura gamaensis]|uniref:ROK family protein n=1 Tax=Actinomadura gamaensis TaxID=1763541 RepID=A0ABV9TTL4_9ACTN
MSGGTPQEALRRRHLGAVLREVHLSGPVSRAALAARLGLNRSTIMALTRELAAGGLVVEEPTRGTGRAGRPSLLVSPAADRAHVLAFDVGVDWLAAARVGLGGVVLDRRWTVRRRKYPDLDDVVTVLAGFARELDAAAPPGTVRVGAGAAFCGMIRPRDGMVRLAPNMGWADQAFGVELGRRLGLSAPVPVGNEAHLGALAEHVRGAGAGHRNVVYLHGDVGIGGGVIVGGRLLDGDGGYGAEAGHMVVNPHGGRPCNCGSRGCLEAEVGEAALLEAAGRRGPAGREGVRAVVTAAARGDPAARRAVRRAGDWLGVGVANLINLFNPGVVIFGGMLRELYPAASAQVSARVAANVLAVSRERVRLAVSALGDDATLVGAAELAFSRVLTDPLDVLAPAAAEGGRRAGQEVR